jgi:hypothetical protein
VGLLVTGGGVQDAIESLSAHPDDWIYRTAIVQRAVEIDHKRRESEINAVADRVGSKVAEVIARAFAAR